MTDIFERLESNDKQTVEYAINSIREQFTKVNESWLLNGLFEYYLNSRSERAMEILVNINEPHHNYLFDRLSDSMRGSKIDTKVQALTLFGYVARRQPTWLYKLQEHCLLKDLLKLLKNEVELLPLISALLVLIVLLPMIPSVMGQYLKDIFDIFSRLACWNCNPGKIVEDQLIHMQVALYALFLRLYGMFPCSFLVYLRNQYKEKNAPVFVHTIKPMLNTVRMHPSLVTASEDTETTTERWKKMGVHDVIVECERFSLDLTDRCPHDSCQYTSGFRSRSGTANSTIEKSYNLQSLKNEGFVEKSASDTGPFFSPSMMYTVHSPPIIESVPTTIPHPQDASSNFPSHEGTSPPEAAVEATPESTPVPVTSATQTSSDLPKSKHLPQPSSPQCITSHESKISNLNQRNESPVSHEDDEEVLTMFGRNKLDRPSESDSTSQCLEDVSDDKLGDEEEHGSPCTAGGLHMPNSKSINKFSKRVRRLRHHSQCNPELDKMEISTGSSPGNSISFPSSTTVRRAVSCPEMKKSPVNPTKDNISRPLDETDEENSEEKLEGDFENVNGLNLPEIRLRENLNSCATQTENFWPYEHLFLGVFPSLENNEIKSSSDSSPAPFTVSDDRILPSSIYDILDRYVEMAVQCSDKNSLLHMKEQLQLVHQQLLFERHRRETHAYRNRRLLSDAKSSRSLEEHNSALRDKVQLQQKDFDDLREQLENYKKERMEEEKKFIKTIHYWENESKMILNEVKMLKVANEVLSRDLKEMQNNCAVANNKLHETQASLLDAVAEVTIAKQQVLAGEKVKKELDQVNKELLLIGELQLENMRRIETFSASRNNEYEVEELKKACEEEIKAMNQQLEAKVGILEAYKHRVIEMEHIILERDNLILSLKQMIQEVNEQRFEKLEAVESKYQTQLIISRALEERIMDLGQRLEFERGKRSVHSPDTSSCHEVNVTTTAGFSPHSSPLSASLASSEGSAAFHEKEVKNLQALVDQKEVLPKSKSGDYGEGYAEFEMWQASSSKND
ncbi:tuberous sclerosis 1 protein hamartin isoform X2 [Leptinotarsa decemlineata]|uniref:tuberous sclerosis 1 protein hamartin isoform X2 n=1 Tax=Leptinotarsa decemlineata TaxID=7539 RepID=UPI003D30543E